MTNLGLEPLPARRTDKEEHWQTTQVAPNLQTFLSRPDWRDDPQEKTPEWIVVTLMHCFFNSIELQEQLKVAVKAGKALDSKAVISLWTAVHKQIEERQAVKQ